MLAKNHNEEKEKNKDFEQKLPKISPYNKRKGRKLEFSIHNPHTSSEESVKHHKKSQESSESSDDNKNKKKYRPYEEIYQEFKIIKLPGFNGEIEKGGEEKAQMSGMKYFQIYNYSDELKAKMTIYNLIGKEDIWWQDLKKVKGIKKNFVTWKNFKKIFI